MMSKFTLAQIVRVSKDYFHPKHSFAIQEVDRIILGLESEYGWPAPKEPLVNELDIQQLRQAIRDIENCRSEPKVWY